MVGSARAYNSEMSIMHEAAEQRPQESQQPASATARGGAGARFDRGILILGIVLLAHVLVLYLAGLLDLDVPRIAGVDPIGYYAYLRSAFFDHDLDFRNEYGALGGIGFASPDQAPTVTGKLPNPYAIGCAFMWLPFFLAGHLWAASTGAPTDGYSQPYHAAIYLANVAYGLAGMLCTYLVARRYFSMSAAVSGTVIVWLCTNVMYYLFPRLPMSHTTSMFVVTIVLWLWARADGPVGTGRAAALGAVGGLAALVRWQNALFMLLPATELVADTCRRDRTGPVRAQTAARLTLMTLLFLIVFSPQLLAWHCIYGRWLTVPQGSGYVTWWKPHLFDVLLSSRHGLISWTPAVAGCLAGLVALVRTHRRIAVGLIAAFLLQLYVNSVAGWTGWSFGMRRFVNCTPLFALGAACLAQLAWPHTVWRRWLLAVATALAVWNMLFAFQYYFWTIPLDDYLTFEQFVTDKLRLLVVVIKSVAGG